MTRGPAKREWGALLKSPLPGDWAEQAACRGMAPTDGVSEHPFFPTRGEKSQQAMEICRACPVLAYCRHYALTHPVTGIWASLPEDERKRWRRRQRRAS